MHAAATLIASGAAICLLCGFTREANAYRESFEAFFDVVEAAGGDCTAMADAMQRWLSAHEDELSARTAAVVAHVDAVSSSEELDRATTWSDGLWAALTEKPAIVGLGRCVHEGGPVGAQVNRFDRLGTNPIAEALTRASARLASEAASRDGANVELASLAGETVLHALRRYGEVVDAYGADCAVLARSIDAWQGSYFALLDAPSQDMVAELQRMRTNELAQLDSIRAQIHALRPLTTRAEGCIDALEGTARDRLRFQTTYLNVFVIDAIVDAPKAHAP